MAPHFLLACGAWHMPEAWHAVQSYMTKAYEYDSTAITLASVQSRQLDMSADVAVIRSAALQLVESGKDVIVVTHSYSGLPGSEAMRGLDKAERTKEGKKGGVIRLVYIMAWILSEDYQVPEPADDSGLPPWMRTRMEDGSIIVSIDDAKAVFYNDMPGSDAEAWAKKLKPWSAECTYSKTTYAGWRHIPTTYVICSADKSVFGVIAKPLLDAARNSSPNAIDTVEELDAGHCPMISRPEQTAQMLARAAGARLDV